MKRMTLAAAINEILSNWETRRPPPGPTSPMTAEHVRRVLDKANEIVGHRNAAFEDAAMSLASPPAMATVAELEDSIRSSRDDAVQRVIQARQGGDNDELKALAEAIAGLSAGLLEDELYGFALNLLGQAARARGDTTTGLGWYEAAQQLGESHGLPGTLCGALDNKGLALASLGRLDEAGKAFAYAYKVAPIPETKVTVAQNWALMLADAGRISQAAGLLHTAAEDSLMGASLPPLQRAVLLDNLATSELTLGARDRAQALLDQARPIFDSLDNKLERAKHAMNRAGMAQLTGDTAAATAAFLEAHDLMLKHWRSDTDVDKYIVAFDVTLARSATTESDAIAEHLQGGLDLINTGRPTEAIPLLKAVFREAEAADARYTAARAAVHVGIALRESGYIEEAHQWLRHATVLAHAVGDVRVEVQALTNLMILADASGEIAEDLTGLSTLLHILALEEILPSIADAFRMDAHSRENYLGGRGATQDQLGRLAASYGADTLARSYFAEALQLAPVPPRHPSQAFSRANRLANKVVALPGDTTPADLEELDRLASTWASDPRVIQTTRRALGLHYLRANLLAQAAEQLQAACAPGEARRRAFTAQQRVDAGSAFDGPWQPLTKCNALLGNADGAMQASQAAKGRHIVDVLDARTTTRRDGAPLNVHEVQQRMDELFTPASTCLVDIGVFSDVLVLVVVSTAKAEVRVQPLPAKDPWSSRIDETAALQGPMGLVKLVREDAILATLAAEIDRLIPEGASVLACLDPVLQQLPLHALLVGGIPWCDRNAWSLLPAIGLLRHISSEPTPHHGRSFVAGDSSKDAPLPGAHRECEAIAQALDTIPALGPECTVSALHDALRDGPLDVLHLAVHGLGDRARGRYSGLVMADGHQGSTLVPFDQLISVGLRADLVVLSGCSTAVTGPLHRSRMAGVAVAAIESGARSVVGCLWPVNDVATEVFMKAFYGSLVSTWDEAPVDLRTCMDAGRAAVRGWAASPAALAGHARDGTRELPTELATAKSEGLNPALAEALAWCPFTLIGDPVLFG
jgi:CHAT domain-containing protein/tetratricopeptide (TPR) repeat protein